MLRQGGHKLSFPAAPAATAEVPEKGAPPHGPASPPVRLRSTPHESERRCWTPGATHGEDAPSRSCAGPGRRLLATREQRRSESTLGRRWSACQRTREEDRPARRIAIEQHNERPRLGLDGEIARAQVRKWRRRESKSALATSVSIQSRTVSVGKSKGCAPREPSLTPVSQVVTRSDCSIEVNQIQRALRAVEHGDIATAKQVLRSLIGQATARLGPRLGGADGIGGPRAG